MRVSRIGRITSSGTAVLVNAHDSDRPRRRAVARGMGSVAFAAERVGDRAIGNAVSTGHRAAWSERPARRVGDRAFRTRADATYAREPWRSGGKSRRFVAAPSARIADGDHRLQRNRQCLRRMPCDHLSADLARTAGRMDLGACDVRAGVAGQRHHAQDFRARLSGRGGADYRAAAGRGRADLSSVGAVLRARRDGAQRAALGERVQGAARCQRAVRARWLRPSAN